jgi:hypothetical protein
MVEFVFPEQAALQSVDQHEDFVVSHVCSEKKRPPAEYRPET